MSEWNVEWRNGWNAEISGGDAFSYVSAAGHNGKNRKDLLRSFAEAQGFEYFQSSSKEETFPLIEKFIDPNPSLKPILFEVFTDYKEESKSLEAINSTIKNSNGIVKKLIKDFLGPEALELARKAKNKYGS